MGSAKGLKPGDEAHMHIPETRSFTVKVEYAMGSTVYLKLCPEKMPGMVCGFMLRPTGIVYLITWGDTSESLHYGFELTDTYEPTFDVTP
jgi:hypothetical protein